MSEKTEGKNAENYEVPQDLDLSQSPICKDAQVAVLQDLQVVSSQKIEELENRLEQQRGIADSRLQQIENLDNEIEVARRDLSDVRELNKEYEEMNRALEKEVRLQDRKINEFQLRRKDTKDDLIRANEENARLLAEIETGEHWKEKATELARLVDSLRRENRGLARVVAQLGLAAE